MLEVLSDHPKKIPSPAKRPARPAFAILGSGISGLAVGNSLLKTYPNAKVTIYTDNAQNIVTYAAAAQFYPIWLGDKLAVDENKLRAWFLRSKEQFIRHQKLGMAIHSARNYELFSKETPPPAYFYDVLSNFQSGPSATLPSPYTHQYVFDTMIINPLLYLPQITTNFVAKGGAIVHAPIRDVNDVIKLKEAIVFNCLGANAGSIFGDSHLRPVKGISLSYYQFRH